MGEYGLSRAPPTPMPLSEIEALLESPVREARGRVLGDGQGRHPQRRSLPTGTRGSANVPATPRPHRRLGSRRPRRAPGARGLARRPAPCSTTSPDPTSGRSLAGRRRHCRFPQTWPDRRLDSPTRCSPAVMPGTPTPRRECWTRWRLRRPRSACRMWWAGSGVPAMPGPQRRHPPTSSARTVLCGCDLPLPGRPPHPVAVVGATCGCTAAW